MCRVSSHFRAKVWSGQTIKVAMASSGGLGAASSRQNSCSINVARTQSPVMVKVRSLLSLSLSLSLSRSVHSLSLSLFTRTHNLIYTRMYTHTNSND